MKFGYRWSIFPAAALLTKWTATQPNERPGGYDPGICQNGSNMLIELWERLRGYDKWVQTEARVATVQEVRKLMGRRYADLPPDIRRSADLVVWFDRDGDAHCGAIVAHDTSPLYQLLGGETIGIRYNPAAPDRYYCRELWSSWAKHLAKALALGLLGLGFIIWRLWMIVKGRGY